MPLMDKLLLRKRAIIESAVDQLKNISQIERTRHRSQCVRQYYCWLGCLLPSAKEAVSQSVLFSTTHGLNIIHVI
jgi:hypothetical protein